jgi:hypothetical protein
MMLVNIVADPTLPRDGGGLRSAMAQSSTRYIGMEGSQESSPGAYATTAHDAEVTVRGAIGTRQADIDQLMRQL